MERRLNEVEWSSTSVPNDSTTGKQIFSSTPNAEHLGVDDDKDRIIRSLESEVEAQVMISRYFHEIFSSKNKNLISRNIFSNESTFQLSMSW